ncbi:MaoC family dehydratase N-terminal domain-containing protein [Alphaproteobacteria bacterium]|nr:MaoC family dehydratase N-terminal domain-containing protein [Alphaproteobacteria bacterium]
MKNNKLENDYANFIGLEEVATDEITISPIWGFYDILNLDANKPKKGDPIPYGSHWCFFQPHVPMNMVGNDGHPKRGSFMPNPPELPRRMFAGSSLTFHKQLKIGDEVKKSQKIISIIPKNGKSGKLLFVKVEEKYTVNNILCLSQLNDIVYREAQKNSENISIPIDTMDRKYLWDKDIKTSTVMLFKYSAITYNGHRIHYDYPYVTSEENYPDLVVHGPLTATLLMRLCKTHSPNRHLKTFKFRAISPIFNKSPFKIKGQPINKEETKWNLWAENYSQHLCMEAEATF